MIILHKQFAAREGITEDFFTAGGAVKDTFQAEAEELLAAYDAELARYGCSQATEMLLRIHLSDITNQAEILQKLLANRSSFISVVGQIPVNGRRIALEAWHWKNAEKKRLPDALQVTLKNYHALWFGMEKLSASGSFDQTAENFEGLKNFLAAHNANVCDHTVRTWLYCRDVDNNYAGLVQARNEFFVRNNLTVDTHFIASTGIEGQMADVKQLVKMDSINYPALQDGQMRYLAAPEMLSPTAIYGVSFERGTRLVFGDRSHYFISGTASIDKFGKVVHLCDVAKQTSRMLDNIQALLESDHGSMQDICMATLYLRDPADAEICCSIIRERVGADLPLVTVKAPVCRPAWLVEMECIAVNNCGNKQFPPLA